MKSSIQRRSKRALVAASMALTLAAASAAIAAPTGQVRGGNTSVLLDKGFTSALQTLGVAVAPEQSARVKGRAGRVAVFPIPAGALDLESLAGEVSHSGGLSLQAGGTTVSLLTFTIDTTSLAFDNDAPDQPVLTGLVVVNGDVLGRLPLFDLALNQLPKVTQAGRVVIRDVDVTLTAGAAEALNGVFGINDLVEGLIVGKAAVRTRLVGSAADNAAH